MVSMVRVDLPVDDLSQLKRVCRFVDSEELLVHNRESRIRSNLREFDSFRVNLLLTQAGELRCNREYRC
jgi:hypothetical protein